MTTAKLFLYEESKHDGVSNEIGEFRSLSDDSNIYESRARDLANIIRYDKETYSDVNIETILRAAEIAGIIKIEKQ